MSNYTTFKEQIISFENYFHSPTPTRRFSLISLSFRKNKIYHSWLYFFDKVILSCNQLTLDSLFSTKSILYKEIYGRSIYCDKIILHTETNSYTIYCDETISHMIDHRLQKFSNIL